MLSRRLWLSFATTALVMLLATACGQAQKSGLQIAWIPGTPPSDLATRSATDDSEVSSGGAAVLQPSTVTAAASLASTEENPVTEMSRDSASIPKRFDSVRPNELGQIPVLMYHVFTDAASTDDGYTRTIVDFRADLQRLYDLDYYVVPLRDIYLDRIAAPPGKHPVVLTFDDATAGQFRYLTTSDGSTSIDPDSAVGVMEDFFGTHPDFGRGGFFAVPPKTCFNWQPTKAEPDQTPFCVQKLTWLLDHGYEIGDHTVDHADLLDLDDEEFQAEVGGGWKGLRALAPAAQPDIMAMPFGNYPDADKHPEQRTWLRDGFNFEGTDITFLGALMVGANPAPSPSSTDWDPLFVPRIRAYDGDYGSTQWLATLADDPSQLYTSDGNPNAIIVPVTLDNAVDRTRLTAEGKRLIEYNPVTGEVV